MAHISICCNSLPPPQLSDFRPPLHPTVSERGKQQRRSVVTVFAAKSGGFSLNSVSS